MIVSLVRFTPGARTSWHSHAVGQSLHVTDGTGLVVTRDGDGTTWLEPVTDEVG
jgi:quercetin dioxygenase-like cupin family protein